MARGYAEFYEEGHASCLTELFGIGTAGEQFIPRLTQSSDHLIGAIATALVETGMAEPRARQRAEDALIAIQGALVLSRARNTTAPFHRILAELPDRLLG